jgi:kynurenine formamidase
MHVPMEDAHQIPGRTSRRQVLQAGGAIAAAAGLTALGLSGGGVLPADAAGQYPSLPADEAMAQAAGGSVWDPTVPPSPWGPGDEAGSSNTQTADKVLQAIKLIKLGTKYLLGHPYEAAMPLFPGNTHQMELKPPASIGRQTGNFEIFHGEIGQNGTQFDALGHFALQPEGDSDPDHAIYYNRFTGADVYHPAGLRHLGIERMKPFFTRGILLDIKRYAKAGRTLDPGEEITMAMVRRTLAAQGLSDSDITRGDVVLFVTGWEERWSRGTLAYYQGAPGIAGATPGIGLEVAIWLASKRVACVGADNWGVEVVPYPNHPDRPQAPAGIFFPVHHELIVKNGIPHQESMRLSELARDLAAARNYLFAYIYTPLPLTGATGSPGMPLAVR